MLKYFFFIKIIIAFIYSSLSLADEHETSNENNYTHISQRENSKQNQHDYFYSDELLSIYNFNYIMPITYSANVNNSIETSSFEYPNSDIEYRPEQLDFNFSNVEIKYQLSLLLLTYKGNGWRLYTYYEQLSFWQAYDRDNSSPFREINYNPGIFIHTEGIKLSNNRVINFNLGLDHESNGQGPLLSRSWNRVIGSANLWINRNDHLQIALWYRLEDKKDDNPDLVNYVGIGEFSYVNTTDIITFKINVGGNWIRGHPYGELNLGFRFNEKKDTVNANLFFQLYVGYAESLIDYNHSISRIGMGIVLN